MRILRSVAAALLGLGLAVASVPAPAQAASRDADNGSPHADGGSRRSPHTVGLSTAAAAASTILCAKVAAKAGYSFTLTVATSLGQEPQIVVAIAVAMAESGCSPHAVNVNSGGSRDRGLWQMNSVYHPEVSDACAFQIQCNADAAWNTSRHGADWNPWSAYTNGSWKKFAAEAKAALSNGFTFQLISSGGGACLAADKTDHPDHADHIAHAAHAAHVDGAPVRQWACDAADAYQQWTVVSSVGAPPILRNAGAGTCLAWDAAQTGNAQPISQAGCSAADANQQIVFVGSGRMNTNGEAQALVQNSHAGTCLDADATSHGNGAVIRQWTCTASDGYQMWD